MSSYLLKDPQSPLLKSDEAFQAYVTCLVRSDNEKSIQSAARRRDTLLTTAPAAASPAMEGSASNSTASTNLSQADSSSESAPAATATPASAPAAKSSQDIAMSVLAAKAAKSNSTSGIDPAKMAATLESMSPVQVSIVERTCIQIWRNDRQYDHLPQAKDPGYLELYATSRLWP